MSKNTGNTETHIAVDQKIREGYTPNAMNEGFASASGVEPETAESGGKIRHAEAADGATKTGKVPNHLDEENAGAAE